MIKEGGSLHPFQHRRKPKPKPNPHEYLNASSIKPLREKLDRFDRAADTLRHPPRHARAKLGWGVQKNRLIGVDGFMNERLTTNLDSKE